MVWRLLSFLLSQVLGGLTGWFVVPGTYQLAATVAGMVLGGWLWFGVDLSRGLRLLRWMRHGDLTTTDLKTGLWAEVADRARRLARLSDQKLKDSEQRLQDFLAAFQASPNGVVLLDLQGRIEWFNQMASTHFGLDASRDRLQHFGNLVRDPGFAAYYAKGDFGLDVAMPGRDHSFARPMRLSVQLHPYGQGRLLLLSRDVTALEQAEAMRRDFVANVSHEIRTPLTVLAGFVETLQTLSLDEGERTRYLDLMARQADRMQTLVSDLLTLSRLEGSPLPPTDALVPMASLMKQLEGEALSLSAIVHPPPALAQQIHLECATEAGVAGTQAELQSAMSNLVSNAVRYTPAGGSIDVQVQELADGRLRFSVRDTGPGVAPEHIGRLTERFYRVDTSRSRDTGGTGLGLAIVKHVAQRHGAELSIDSVVGAGSTFSLTFPVVRVRRGLPPSSSAVMPSVETPRR